MKDNLTFNRLDNHRNTVTSSSAKRGRNEENKTAAFGTGVQNSSKHEEDTSQSLQKAVSTFGYLERN